MPLSAKDLIAFLETLSDSGFEASNQQYLAAHKLMAALAGRNEWPIDVSAWRSLLAPVLCSTPAQQREFYRKFDDWVGAGSSTAAEHQRRERKKEKIRPRPSWKWAAALAPLLIAAIWFGVHEWRARQRPVTGGGPVVDKTGSGSTGGSIPAGTSSLLGRVTRSNGLPVAGATLYYQAKQSTSNQAGDFLLQFERRPSGFPVLVTHDQYAPALAKVEGNATTLAVTMLPREPEKAWSWPLAHFGAIRTTAAAIPAVAILAWALWVARRRLQLKKWETPLQPQVRQVAVQRGGALFGNARIRKLALELRRRKPRISIELSPDATVEATARSAGYFTPVFATHRAQPEYLVIGERIGPRDQQARFQDELFSALQKQDVNLDRYYFQSDPRVCRPAERGAASYALQDLAAVHPHHSLWLLCDAARLLDPATGEPWPWLSALSAWQDRAILTPQPEKPLASLDFKMAPANPDGIDQICDTTNAPKTAASAADYPPLLRDQPERWIEREPPPAPLIARLSVELRQYMGPAGYQCLAACAVYPGLAWNLTLRLAEALLPASELGSTIERLVRLPWFRYGMMPEWLRIKLKSSIPKPLEQRILKALESCLDSPAEGASGGEVIELARKKAVSSTGDGPLQDYVFLSFLWGRKLDPLAVFAPSRWKRLLFDQGVIAFGLRPLAALILAFGFAAGMWFGLGAAKRWIEPPPKVAPARAPMNPLLARALDVAESQIGRSWGSAYVFIYWCFINASDVLGKQNPVTGDGQGSFIEDYAGADAFNKVEPGHVFLTKGTIGIVESVLGQREIGTIEAVSKGTVVRNVRPLGSADLGFIDWSKRIAKGPDTPGGGPTPTVDATRAQLTVQIRSCSNTLEEFEFRCVVEIANTGSAATRNLQYESHISWDTAAIISKVLELGQREARSIPFQFRSRLETGILTVRATADNADAASAHYNFQVNPNLPLRPNANGEIRIPLISSEWVGPSQENTACNPFNPRETGFARVATPAGLGLKLSTAAEGGQCCNCTRRGATFSLDKPIDTPWLLTGWFEAVRGSYDTYSLASFQVDLYSSKQRVQSQVFAAEHRPNNNCMVNPGAEILLKSGENFSVPLTGVKFDEIRIYLQGYGCLPSTNSVTLSNLKLVKPPAAGR